MLNAHKTHHTKVCHLSEKKTFRFERVFVYFVLMAYESTFTKKWWICTGHGGMVMGRFDGLAEHQMRGMGCPPVKCLLVDEVYDPHSIINIRIYQLYNYFDRYLPEFPIVIGVIFMNLTISSCNINPNV